MNSDLPFLLTGECAVITGGGTGIGLGIAACMVEAGARVVLVGRREEPLRQAVAALGERATYVCGDVTRTDALAGLVERIGERAGEISILVNNAGIGLKKPAAETTAADMTALLETHVIGAHQLTRLVAPAMIERGRGSILFISSMTAFLGAPLVSAYSAAKSAVSGLVRAFAAELSPHGVRVNAVAPGWIETPMLEKALAGDPARRSKILGRTPMASFGCAADVGWAAVYLCSAAARFVTGAILPVDGGASIGF